MSLEVGQQLTLTIDGFAAGGLGVAHHAGRAIFVPQTIPQETIVARITHLGRKKISAELVEIVEPAADRVTPVCPVYERCGGCQLLHVAYQAQLDLKKTILLDALRSIAGLEYEPELEIVPAPAPLAYRNRGQYPVARKGSKVVTGFFAARSHNVIAVEKCHIHDQRVDQAVSCIRAWAGRKRVTVYDEKRQRGFLRHAVVRVADNPDQLLVALVGKDDRARNYGDLIRRLRRQLPQLRGLVLNINPQRTNVILGKRIRVLWGQPDIDEHIDGLRFRLSVGSFFQVNTLQAAELFRKVRKFLKNTSGPLVDAFCGVGVMACLLAKDGHETIGIEVAESAVADARQTLELNRLSGVTFHQGRVEQVLPKLIEKGLAPGGLVLDPPRKGCAAEVLQAVADSKAERVAYVSCHPGSLARDLARLFELGYELETLEGVDMFPQTAHLEVFAGLVRR
jgi:23S rRNA (uracil1939-C5)-methyltransferase